MHVYHYNAFKSPFQLTYTIYKGFMVTIDIACAIDQFLGHLASIIAYWQHSVLRGKDPNP